MNAKLINHKEYKVFNFLIPNQIINQTINKIKKMIKLNKYNKYNKFKELNRNYII